MSEYNAKNYTEQGGEVTHIGGKIVYDNGLMKRIYSSGTFLITAITTQIGRR